MLKAPFPWMGLLISGECANINPVTQAVSGRFVFHNAVAKTEYSFWAKRPMLSDSRPAACVTATADNVGRFAMDKKYIKLFWEKVDKTDSCWLWTAAKTEKGYGVAWDGNHTQKAHRVSFMLANGYMPDLCVLHRCDVPGCVNPDHLFLGTRADNNRDMCAKGRHGTKEAYQNGNQKRGETHHASKMTAEKVRQMREDYATGSISYSKLAEKYGLSLGNTYRIVNHQGWKHVK